MLGEPVTVTTTSSVPTGLDYRGGPLGELIVVYNPATNTNLITLALNRDATTAAVTGQQVVAPGQFSLPFVLNQEQNAGGISAVAATGTTVVSAFRYPFRSTEEMIAVLGGIAGGLVAGQFWVQISATAIALAASLTEARADRIDRKTTGTGLTVGPTITNGVSVGSVALAALAARVGVSTTYMEMLAASAAWIRGGTSVLVANSTKTYFNGLGTGTGLEFDAGDGTDPRHTLSSTDRVMHTPVAGGLLSSTMDSIEMPIANGVVIAIADNVEIVGGSNRVQLGTALSTGAVGPCIQGGTGNVGGTVMARIRINGVLAQTLIADVAGVTAGLYLQFGAVSPATRVQDKATVEGTFGRTLTTAASGALTDAFLKGLS